MPRFQPKENYQEAAEKPPVISGVGESKTHNDPDPASQRDPYEHIKGCHVGGKPVEEVVPVANAHLVSYQHTDEGIAERNKGRIRTGIAIEGAKDEFDLALERHGDEEIMPWQMTNPMEHIKREHVPEGMRPHLLSDQVVNSKGMRGWEVVKKDNGDPVKFGRMVLGVMPEEMAEKRNKYFRDESRQRLQEAGEQVSEQQERLIRDSGGAVAPLGPGEPIRGSTRDGQGRAMAPAPSGATTGLHRTRGNSTNEV